MKEIETGTAAKFILQESPFFIKTGGPVRRRVAAGSFVIVSFPFGIAPASYALRRENAD